MLARLRGRRDLPSVATASCAGGSGRTLPHERQLSPPDPHVALRCPDSDSCLETVHMKTRAGTSVASQAVEVPAASSRVVTLKLAHRPARTLRHLHVENRSLTSSLALWPCSISPTCAVAALTGTRRSALSDVPIRPSRRMRAACIVVLRTTAALPVFLAAGGGGWWKGKDPTAPVERLQREWVDGTPTLYIGKAKSLRERVGELLQFSDGRPVRHWGGRLLWQLHGCQDLLLAWRQEPDCGGAETELIDEFPRALRPASLREPKARLPPSVTCKCGGDLNDRHLPARSGG